MITAQSAITLDGQGREVWSKNPDRQSEGASTVKVVTCWLARQQLNMTEQIEVLDSDDIWIPPTHALRGGDIARTDDTIRSSLIVSDNYGAQALARTMGTKLLQAEGTPAPTPTAANDRYCTLAMDALTAFGWTDHLIRNGSGIESVNRFTARQIAQLFRHVRLTDPWLHEAAGMVSYTFPITGGRNRTITPQHSARAYIDQIPGWIAGKTGTAFDGTAFLVWSWQHPSGQVMTSALFDSTTVARPADAAEVAAQSAPLVSSLRFTDGTPAVLRTTAGDLAPIGTT